MTQPTILRLPDRHVAIANARRVLLMADATPSEIDDALSVLEAWGDERDKLRAHWRRMSLARWALEEVNRDAWEARLVRVLAWWAGAVALIALFIAVAR